MIGQTYRIKGIDELSQYSPVEYEKEGEIYVKLQLSETYTISYAKSFFDKGNVIVFSYNYRDYSEPCYCKASDWDEFQDWIGMRMHWSNKNGFWWLHDECSDIENYLGEYLGLYVLESVRLEESVPTIDNCLEFLNDYASKSSEHLEILKESLKIFLQKN